MTPEQWQLVTRLLAQCLDNPRQDPKELLADSDVTDEIRLEVQALLGAHEKIPQSFLENCVPNRMRLTNWKQEKSWQIDFELCGSSEKVVWAKSTRREIRMLARR